MKIFFSLQILLITCINITNAQSPKIDSITLAWQQYRLNNGICVLLQPDSSVNEISVEFWVGVGSRDEPTGYHGFVHFLEHATPYGLTRDRAAQTALIAFRTNSNAQVRKDYTRYSLYVKPAGLELALRSAADRLRADTADITDTIIEQHRKNVLSEMNRNDARWYGPTASTAIYAATFGSGHPYGHSNYGSFQENESFSARDVRQWYEQFFFTNNIVLFIVGNFDETIIKTLIEKEFGSIHRMGKRPPVPKLKNIPVVNSVEIPAAINTVSLSWKVPGWSSFDAASLKLLAHVVDKRLRATGNTTVTKASATTLTEFYELEGIFGVNASFANRGDSNYVETFLDTTITSLIDKGVTNEELQFAHAAIFAEIKEMQQQLGFIGSRTELLGEGLLFANNPNHYLERFKQQSKLTTRDIQKAAARWLKGNAAVIRYMVRR